MSDAVAAYVWPLFAAYLWIMGGLHWTFQYEAEREVRLSTVKRGVMILCFPTMTVVALVTTVVMLANHAFSSTLFGAPGEVAVERKDGVAAPRDTGPS